MSMIGRYRQLTRQQLAELQVDPSRVPDFLYDQEPPSHLQLDIDKTWHAIHFLLNGDRWEGTGPLYDAVLGGEVLGKEDLGYGPARFLTADEVKETAAALDEISVSDLLDKLDAQELNDNDIYPRGWTGEQIDLQYIKDYFLRLVIFFRSCADSDHAMLLYIA